MSEPIASTAAEPRPARALRYWHWLIVIGALGGFSALIGGCTRGAGATLSATRAAGVATYATSGFNLIQAGDTVVVAGFADATLNGTLSVTGPAVGANASKTFTVAQPGAAAIGAAATGGTLDARDTAGAMHGSWWEAMLLGWAGGLVAWGWTSLLLWLGRDRPGVGLLTCVGFLLSPIMLLCEFLWLVFGAVVGRRIRFHASPTSIILLAVLVGWYDGTLDGTWGVRTWSGFATVPLDYSWGLSGATNAALVHLYDGPDQHVKLELAAGMSRRGRRDCHQYIGGFGFRAGSTFTQSCVMSNQGSSPSVFDHEVQHIWQNRCFGPLFTFLYLLWMAVMLVPGFLVGLVQGDPGGGVNAWAYVNNPWEVWGYSVGGGPNGDQALFWADSTVARGAGTAWSPLTVLSFALLLHVGALVLAQGVLNGWLRGRARWWRMFGSGGGYFLLRTALVALNLTTNAVIAVGFGAVAPAIGGVIGVALLIQVMALVEPVARERVWQAVTAWSSFLLPTSLAAHVFGFVLFIANLLGALLGLALGFFEGLRESTPVSGPAPGAPESAAGDRSTSAIFRLLDWPRFEFASCHLISFGGFVARLHPSGVNLGMFSFGNPAALADRQRLAPPDRQFLTGLLLNNATFGHLQISRFFDAPYPDQRAAFWDAMAESRVDAGARQHAAFAAETAARPRIPQWGPGEGSGLMASRPEFFIGIGMLIVLLLVFFAFVYTGWPGTPDDCLTGNCYCERARPGTIRQPSNTFFNVSFMLSGLIMLWGLRDPRRPSPAPNPLTGPSAFALSYGLTVVFLGPGSMFYHASLMKWGGFVDNLSMFLWVGWVLAYDVVRVTGRRQPWVFFAIWAGVIAPCATVTAINGVAGKIFFGIWFGCVGLFELAIGIFHLGGVRRGWAWLIAALATFAVAFVIWYLSGGKLTGRPRDIGPLCFPDSWLQGHAVWHMLCALATWLFWKHLRRENTPSTR